MIRIAVCDDVYAVCSELENIILDFQKQTNEELTVESFYSGEDLIKYIKNENTLDLIFLDIELGKINGVEVGQVIRCELEDYITKIVYISSKNSYDRQLFEVQPLHFLSKPLNREKVIKDLQLAIKILEKENKMFSFKIGQQIYKIPVKEIIYFESIRREIKLVSIKETLYFYDTMDDVYKRLSKNRFIKPHRSYIVNYNNVLSIKKDEIKVCNGDTIPLSRLNMKEIKEFQIAYEEEMYN
ncbi:MAG: LytTR family DNA-binding domain-containing protein [Sedimentibacter sp.]